MAVYFRSSIRQNPATGRFDGYYRLIESYRNADGRACHRTLLNIGFMEDVDVDRLNKVQAILNARHRKLESLFEESDPVVVEMADSLWRRLVGEKRIDVDWADKAARRGDPAKAQQHWLDEMHEKNFVHTHAMVSDDAANAVLQWVAQGMK